MNFSEYLEHLLAGQNLNETDASKVMDAIMGGKLTDAQIAGFLVALRRKGETAEEVAGFARSMRTHSVSLEINDALAVDSVGTGGDGAGTFNISTAAGIVAAGAGITVAKHGNRSISSRCGSADLLEAAGGDIDPGPDVVKNCIDQTKFGFMFAPRFHPAMKHAITARRQLGVRTVFNILGPLTNPAGVRRMVLGVYSRELMELMADVLLRLGIDHALVVHSQDGHDELSVSAPTYVIELKNGRKREFTVHPQEVGLSRRSASEVAGGEAQHNASILRKLLNGEKGSYRDVVLLNAAAVAVVAGEATDLAEGVRQAAEAIDSGRAKKVLHDWIQMSNGD